MAGPASPGPAERGGRSGRPRPRRLWLRLLGFAFALTALSVAVVKKADENNRFCIACHLHQKIYDQMVAAPAVTLAGAHFHAASSVVKPLSARDQDRLSRHPERCFTCHSGEGATGWSAVTLLSAWDAARWVAGDRHEPTSMRLPIENAACLKCHADAVRGTLSSEETDQYHPLAQHRSVKLPCVSCHQTHRPGVPAKQFLDDATVRAQCQSCHRSVDEG